MAYCIYLRKSRTDDEAEARGEMETLARHEDALLALGKRLKLPITAIYKEVVSGETISARPVIQGLLSEVEKGCWQGVLVMEVERLARGDTIDQGIIAQTFKYSDTKIITPNKTYDPSNEFDEEYFEFGLFMSRREYKTINRRLTRGRMASISEGKYVGNKAPFGYERVKLQKEKGYSFTIIDSEADIIKLIFEYYTLGKIQPDGTAQRLGFSKIANELNLMGVKTATGLEWNYNAISTIMRNPVYIGKIKWGSRAQLKKVVDGKVVISRPRKNLEDTQLTDGLHQPIISEEQFYTAQDIINQNKRRTTPAKYVDKNPLAGLIICSDCGSKMTRRPYLNGYADTLLCQAKNCKNASSALSLVESAVLHSLEAHLEQFRADSNMQRTNALTQDTSKTKLLNSSKVELEKIQKQMSNLYDLLEQGVYSKELFFERSNTLTKRSDEIQASIKQFEDEIAEQAHREKLKSDIVPRIEHVLNTYHSVETAKQKRLLLESVIEKVLYKKQAGGRWKVAPDDFLIELYPKM